MTGSGMPLQNLALLTRGSGNKGGGSGWGGSCPGHRLRALAGPHPSCLPHFTPPGGMSVPPENRRPVLQPQPGLREWGLGYSCQQDRPVGPCRTLLRSVGLTDRSNSRSRATAGTCLMVSAWLSARRAGDSGGRSHECSRARRSGLHEVGYMLQMSVSSAMLLDLSAWPAQFLPRQEGGTPELWFLHDLALNPKGPEPSPKGLRPGHRPIQAACGLSSTSLPWLTTSPQPTTGPTLTHCRPPMRAPCFIHSLISFVHSFKY